MEVGAAALYFFMMSLAAGMVSKGVMLVILITGVVVSAFYYRRSRVCLILSLLLLLRVMTGINFREYSPGDRAEILVRSQGSLGVVERIDGRVPQRRSYLELNGGGGRYLVDIEIGGREVAGRGVYYEGEVYERIRVPEGIGGRYLKERIENLTRGYSRRLEGFYMGVIAGEREGIPEELKRDFSYTGTSHLIVISGLHIGVITALLIYLFTRMPLSHDQRYFMIMGILSLYVAAVGMSPSVIRAYIMGMCYLGGNLLYEEPDTRKSYFTAMVVNILADPLGAGRISFQMSYMAVFAILFVYPEIHRRIVERNLPRVPGMIVAMGSLSLVIQVMLTPIFMMNFRNIPLFSFLINIIAIPLGTLFVQGAFLALLMSFAGAGQLVMPAVNILYWVLEYFISASARLPLLSMEYRGAAGGWLLMAVYMGMLNLIYSRRKVYSLIPLVLIGVGLIERYGDFSGEGYTYYSGHPRMVVTDRRLGRSHVEEMWNNRIRRVDLVVSSRKQDRGVKDVMRAGEVVVLKEGEVLYSGEKVVTNREGVLEVEEK